MYERLKENRVLQFLYYCSFGWVRHLYEWVLSLAESKHAEQALCALAFAESSFFPIPVDVLQITLSLAKPKRSYWYAFLSTVFSIFGGIFGYLLGYFLYESIGKVIIESLGYQHYFLMIGNLYQQNAFLAILGAAFTPIPYKVFTLAAGFWQLGIMPLIVASLIGRAGRFFIVATLTYFYGERVKEFLEKHFNWLTFAFFMVGIVIYVSLRYWW